MAGQVWQRDIQCEDAFGRDRSLSVIVRDDGRLMLLFSNGEAAILAPGAGGNELKRHIDNAQRAAADLLLGRAPSPPALTGHLRDASTFYVLDREERTQPLGVGLNGARVAFNGPRGFWQVDDAVAAAIASKMLALAQISRDLRRR